MGKKQRDADTNKSRHGAKIPSRVQVGPLCYKVSTDELQRHRAEALEGAFLYGHHDPGSLCLVIDAELADDAVRDVLLHEALHALSAVIGLNHEWGKEKEEAILQRLSPALLDLLRRNPRLVAFLMADR